MSNYLCIYYSRSGVTQKAMEQLAQILDAESVRIEDDCARSGPIGYLHSGFDAMAKTLPTLKEIKTARPLSEYDCIILGVPVWAGRCAAPMRSFLNARGNELKKTAFVITHISQAPYEQVYAQMDAYLSAPHTAAASLQQGAADWLQKLHDLARALRGEGGEQ